MSSLAEKFRSLRHRFKAVLPYVRRREYRILKQKYEALCGYLAQGAHPANKANLLELKTPTVAIASEVCLFVSFVAEPQLKPHVIDHLHHLIRQGIKVILIVNTDLSPKSFTIKADLSELLSGIFIRENIGFDFAAWAQIYGRHSEVRQASRLFLINDSMVGPLNAKHFDQIIQRIRTSQTDVLGLTECLAPRRHLQSFFLVFNARALKHPAVQQLLEGILNLSTKSQVIDVYESHLTATLEAHGIKCGALFPSLSNDPYSSNDVFLRWEELVRQGCPYIKTSIIRSMPKSERICALVPEAYRNQ